MRIIITGGCGFLGRHVARLAKNRGDDVLVIDTMSYAADPHANPDILRGEWDCRRVEPREIARHWPFDAIIHLAAESHVDNSIEGPMVFATANYLGTANMLEVARKLEIPKFIYMSTDEVTGAIGPEDRPTDAFSAIMPSSPYSASKAGGELLALAYARTFNMDVRVVRSTNIYGPYQHPEKFIPRCITYILDGRKAPLYGDGRQSRDWIHVLDAAHGVLAALKNGVKGQVYCLGARNERENRDVVERIARALGGSIEHVADRKGHDFRYATDPLRTEQRLCWRAHADWSAQLHATIAWYKENEPWWREAIRRGGRW